MYQIVITPSAKRSLKKLPVKVRNDLLNASLALEVNPLIGEKLTGPLSFLYSFHFRSQGVDYRLAYTINIPEKKIIVHLAHTRENFYEKLRRLFK